MLILYTYYITEINKTITISYVIELLVYITIEIELYDFPIPVFKFVLKLQYFKFLNPLDGIF